MLKRRISILAPVAALVATLIAAGCAGGAPGTAAGSRLNFTPSENFNGTAAALEADHATTTTSGGHIVATMTSGTRTVTVTFPADALHAGDTFDVGVDGTTVTYTETRNGATYTWVGAGGQVTVNATVGEGEAVLDVTGVNFTADATIQGNPALGSFTLDGNIDGIPISGGGGIGGQAILTLTEQQTTNADLSSFADATIAYAQLQSNGTLGATTGSGDTQRVLAVVLTQNAQVGDVIDLSNMQNGKATATFTQGANQNVMIWTAHAGTIKVMSRTDTTAKVLFTNALFTGTAGNAAGTFTVNGTLSRR